MAKQRDVIGRGMSFPPRVGADGRIAWSGGEPNVRESVRVLLLTEPGERVMRERFGCGLRRYLFEPNTATTRKLIRQRIADAITRYEPRAAVQQVTVTPDDADPRAAAVHIRFRLVATGAVEQLGMTLTFEA